MALPAPHTVFRMRDYLQNVFLWKDKGSIKGTWIFKPVFLAVKRRILIDIQSWILQDFLVKLLKGPLQLRSACCSASGASVSGVNTGPASKCHQSGMSICPQTLQGAADATLQTCGSQTLFWELILHPRPASGFSVHLLMWTPAELYLSWEFFQPCSVEY